MANKKLICGLAHLRGVVSGTCGLLLTGQHSKVPSNLAWFYHGFMVLFGLPAIVFLTLKTDPGGGHRRAEGEVGAAAARGRLPAQSPEIRRRTRWGGSLEREPRTERRKDEPNGAVREATGKPQGKPRGSQVGSQVGSQGDFCFGGGMEFGRSRKGNERETGWTAEPKKNILREN